MSSVTAGINHLISSVLEIFAGIFNAIVSAFQSVFSVVKNLVASLVDLLSGFAGFILGLIISCIGNIFIIAVLILAFVGYQRYTAGQSGKGKGKKRA